MPWHELLIDAALLALSIAALAFAAAGLLLCLRPPASPVAPADRPPGGLLGVLDTPRRIERFIYRHHYAAGLIIMLSAAFYLWRIGRAGLLWPPAEFGFQAPLLWLLTLAVALAFVLGAVMLVRPSRLKPVEARANQWIGPESGTAREWLLRHPRARGILILAVSLYGVLVFASLLADRITRWWAPAT